MARILTIGSATQDIFLLTEGAETVRLQSNNTTHAYMIFQQGAKIDVPELHYAVGGGAANAAVGLSRLGHQLESYFYLGNDQAGETIRNQMLAEGVSVDAIQTIEDGSTATSFIIPSIEKNHVVFVYRGVNAQLSVKTFPLELLYTCNYLFFAPLSGRGKDLLSVIAPVAKKQNVTVISNPGLGQLAHDPHAFIAQLPLIDYLILNAREASTLLDALSGNQEGSQEDRLCKMPLAHMPACAECAVVPGSYRMPCFILEYMRELIQRGPSILVVTNGTEGVYVATRDTLYFHPSIHTEPVSALGAGDAFSSGFIGALAHKKSLEEAIIYGVINASSVIQSLDAQEGLLSLKELENRAQNQGLIALKTCSMQIT